MKKICEIYDVSHEYEMKENSVLVCVSNVEQDKLLSILPELKLNFNKVFSVDEWQQYLGINQLYNRNESKHQMREIRQSKRIESDILMRYETDSIAEKKISKALFRKLYIQTNCRGGMQSSINNL